MTREWKMGAFEISTDRARLDMDVIHGFLSSSYWSPGVDRGIVERAAAGSMCFGVYEYDAQVGYARVITDRATFAYLADVFILESHRGRGLGTWLVSCIRAHPDLQELRRWLLATADAHGLYERFGFQRLAVPSQFMEIRAITAATGTGHDQTTESARVE